MILSHKIALDPTPEQIQYFKRACGTARFVYNWGLAEWNRQYKEAKESGNKIRINGNTLLKQFNKSYKEDSDLKWISKVHKDCHSRPFASLDKAFKKFFNKKAKYPKFHKKGRKDSFYLSNNVFKISGYLVRLPFVGQVRTFEELRFAGKIMSGVVSREANKWYISIAVDVGDYKCNRIANCAVGIDLGIKQFAIFSNGEVVDGPNALKKNIKKLKRLSRKHSRRQKGSNNRRKSALRLAKLHAHIKYIRHDFLHKLTTKICRENQTVAIEDLRVSGMIRNHCLARSINDQGWGEFRRQLEYKSKIYDNTIKVIDRFAPTSKTCSKCGHIKTKILLSERTFNCESCGYSIDRDLNAAINIRTLGLRGTVSKDTKPVDRTTPVRNLGETGIQPPNITNYFGV